MRKLLAIIAMPWEIGLGFITLSFGWRLAGAALLASAIVTAFNLRRDFSNGTV